MNFYIDQSLNDEIEFGEFSSFGFASNILESAKVFSLKIGLEHAKQLKNKLEIYYGAEIGFQYSKSKRNEGTTRVLDMDGDVQEILVSLRYFEENRITVGIFGGIRYRINKTFGLSVESGVEMYYGNSELMKSRLILGTMQETKGDIVNSEYFLAYINVLKFLNFEINF